MKVWSKILFLVIAVALYAAVPANGAETSSPKSVTATASPAAFYVAPNGNDSNPGTLVAPFATFMKCRSAMEASTTKTCYIRGGSYRPTIDPSAPTTGCAQTHVPVALYLGSGDSGESWSYYAPDGVDSAVIDGGASSTTTGLGGFVCIDADHGTASNITINGLQLQHFGRFGILAVGPDSNDVASNITITNNEIHEVYNPGPDYPLYGCNSFGAIQAYLFAENVTISNNYVYNITGVVGIGAYPCTMPGNLSGLTIENNVLVNTCSGWTGVYPDCGAIYIQDSSLNNNTGTPWSTNMTVKNNFIRDVGVGSLGPAGGGNGPAIYLDDGTSNVTATGNIITGHIGHCFTIHGGDNNTFRGNICDEGVTAGGYILTYQTSTNGGPDVLASAAGSGSILTFSPVPPFTTGFCLVDLTNTGRISSGCTVVSETPAAVTTSCDVSSVQSGDTIRFLIPMTGNVVSGNIFVNNASSVGYIRSPSSSDAHGFHGGPNGAAYGRFSPPNPQTSIANDYFTYGSTAPDDTGSGGANSDSNAQHVNPQFSGCYVIAPGSPVLAAPINFPTIKGGWGPPGFTLPVTGSVRPSYPIPTC